MNFLGHLAVARWERDDAAFGLGAMLPDFMSMAGARATVLDADVAAGMALHHRTDDVFHVSPSFLTLSRDAFEALLQRGVARGPARAVAHIGVELLIDGELVRQRDLARAYVSALTALLELPEASFAADATPLRRLGQRLLAHGIPYDYERPERVTARLISILARRPRLALDPRDTDAVGSVLSDLKAGVVQQMEALFHQLARGLSSPRYSATITD